VMLRIHRHAAGVERAEAIGAWVHRLAHECDRGPLPQRESAPRGGDRRRGGAGKRPARRRSKPSTCAPSSPACIAPLLKRLPGGAPGEADAARQGSVRTDARTGA
jgi:hypothetical protein